MATLHGAMVELGREADWTTVGAVVAVQADDTKLVSASIDGSVRCWDLRTGAQLFALDGHSRHITSLHFEGPLLVSDGTGGNVVVHDFSGKVRS